MIPTNQTILHDPANGQHRNCFSAVLASLLHLPIETIPVFSNPANWVKELNAWLRPHGLGYLSFPAAGFEASLAAFGIVGLHHEIDGMTARFADVGHSCVAKDAQLVFDPHPSRDGLPTSVDGCGVFIALRPWQAVNSAKAAKHLLRQMHKDPRLAYLIGPGSESYELLTEAVSQEQQVDVEEIRRQHSKGLKFEAWPSEHESATGGKS